MLLDDYLEESFGKTLTAALDELREKLEDGKVSGGIAVELGNGGTRPILTHEWTRWNVVHNINGMSLLRGCKFELIPDLYNFHWPSAEVRTMFPAGDQCVEDGAPTLQRGKLPPHAKPNDYRHEEHAHDAAEIVRREKILPGTAFKKVAPDDPMRQPDSVIRAIRDAYDLMYLQDGTPRPN